MKHLHFSEMQNKLFFNRITLKPKKTQVVFERQKPPEKRSVISGSRLLMMSYTEVQKPHNKVSSVENPVFSLGVV